MSKSEIISLKEEFLKEIRELEKNLNHQMTKKIKELVEKNDKFIQDFEQLSKNNQSLTDLISKKNLDSIRINEFDIFKKRAETMIITHDIKISTAIKDISDIKFTLAKEISENLTFPGSIGPLCRYKNLSQYISANINDVEKIKNDIELFKRENRETKRKIEDIFKTSVNLVDKSNEKSIEYINKKLKNSEDIVNNKFAETNDKIINLKASLLSQDKIDEFRKNILDEINDINYTKKEIDLLMSNILKNLEINLDNIKNEFKHDIYTDIKTKTENIENEIKEINKNIKDIHMKIIKSNQSQNKFFNEVLTLKNRINKNSGNDLKTKDLDENDIFGNNYQINKNIFKPLRTIDCTKTTRKNKMEEEKINKNRIVKSFEKTKNIDSIKTIKVNSSKKVNVKDLKDSYGGKNDNGEISKDINNLDKINDNSFKENKEELNVFFDNENTKLNNSSSDKNNISYNYINDIYEENINSVNEEDKDEDKKYLISTEKKIKFRMNPFNLKNTKYKSSLIKNFKKGKGKTQENSLKKHSNLIAKKDQQKALKNNQKIDLANIISYGVNNKEKLSIIPLEQNTNKTNKEVNTILSIFEKTNSTIKLDTYNNPINNIKKETKKNDNLYSLYKLASIEANEKIEGNFIHTKHLGKLSKKTKNLVKPLRQEYSPLYLSYDSSLNNKNRNNNNYFSDKKITSAFGSTRYSIYNKKEEGIQNLVNKKINSNNKKYKNKKGDFNAQLSTIAKIKIFEN